MRGVVAAVLLIPIRAAFAADAIGNTSNGTDLRKDQFFGRPLTVLEFVTANVASKAAEVGPQDFPTKSYSLDKSYYSPPEGIAGYEARSGRTILVLQMGVAYMADPWREVCLTRLRNYYSAFNFPDKSTDHKLRSPPDIQLQMMKPYFGPMTETDPANATKAIDSFLNSIITRVTFYVIENGSLKFTRRCQLDNDTGKIAYDEYRYPDK